MAGIKRIAGVEFSCEPQASMPTKIEVTSPDSSQLLHSAAIISGTPITVLTSMRHTPVGEIPLMQKKFWIDESGDLAEKTFQHAMLYGVESPVVNNIQGLAELVERISSAPRKIIIRGHSLTGQIKGVRKKNDEFAEPPLGIPWVLNCV